MLTSSLGCLEDFKKQVDDSIAKVDLNFPTKKMDIGKDKINSTISYKSTYKTPQTVTITLRASDDRIGLSWDEFGEFKPSISLTEEVGRNHDYSKNFYIFIIGSSTPLGEYDIDGSIKGVKSNDTSKDVMTLVLK